LVKSGRANTVRPFRGLRYNPQRIPDPSAIITPPYDVISPSERRAYHDKSPYSFIRLEFGEELPGDSEDANKYTRAAVTLSDWLRDGVLIREGKPALYILEQRFRYRDQRHIRQDLIAAVRLEDFESGRVRPHEQTTRKPAEDRLNLLRACGANLSPIMGLVSTGGRLVDLLQRSAQGNPDMIAKDALGVELLLWVVSDDSVIEGIAGLLADKPVYIADGHHRYEMALRYKTEQCAATPGCTGEEPFNFVMMSLTDSNDPGIVMSPTHRLVKGVDLQPLANLTAKIQPYFDTSEEIPGHDDPTHTADLWLRTLEVRRAGGVVLGLYAGKSEGLRLLKLQPDADLHDLMDEDELSLWRDSDVILLQRAILEKGLGMDSPDKLDAHISYTRDAEQAIECVDSGECQLAFLLNPAPVSSLIEAADAGKRLPQKSTYFFPKTPAGLVINPLWED